MLLEPFTSITSKGHTIFTAADKLNVQLCGSKWSAFQNAPDPTNNNGIEEK